MASSSSSEEYGTRRPKPLARHDSSFLGAIKNIVTAPLTWFAHQDGDATPGKRRRASPSPSPAPPVVEDDSSRRSKRMRVYSPPVQPPRSSVVPRASSAVLPSSRATISPRRHQPIVRTMSIDPPRRDPSFNFAYEPDDEMSMLVDRDSRPPSPRPSFRMRSSITPQPQQPPARYISEPPPLNSLVSNPVFVRAPTRTSHEPSPAPTLGSIIESVRATKSPTRQNHSSLVFSIKASDINNENKDAPAERALHQLDVYKTPLLPTRLRSSNLPASVTATKTPDMFKSRRSSHLVLMQDDRDRQGRRVSGSGRSPVVNETKPYAGEGGMKKLLARRKQEEEEENEQDQDKDEEGTTPRQPSPPPAVTDIPPIPSGSDWFSTATSGSSSSGSSLRVGRSKTSRNHIQRPAKTRFSAVYDEEADDAMEEDENRQKERLMLEEAAKKVPVFKIPDGFSFAKPVSPVQQVDTEDAKEPPISSLPFSFSKPTSVSSQPPPTASTSLEVPSAKVDVPTPEPKVTAPAPAPPLPASVSGSGIPNFFANSAVLAKAKETPPPTPPSILSFGPPPTKAPLFGTASATSSQPVKDAENPFWDGEKKIGTEESKSSLFAGFGKPADTGSIAAVPVSIFGNAAPAFPSVSKSTTEATSQSPFSFGKPATDEIALKTAFGSSTSSDPPKLPFSFGAPPDAAKPQGEKAAPKPIFGVDNTTSLFGDSSKTLATSSLSADQHKDSSVPQPTPSPLSFNFGTPQSSTSAPAPASTSSQPSFFGAASNTQPSAEAPKPLFGTGSSGNSGFSFGQPPVQKKEDEAKPTPFTFGQPSAQKKEDEAKPAPFSFGQPSAQKNEDEAKSTPFTFGQPSAQKKEEAKAVPFSFGQPLVQDTSKETKPAPFSFGNSSAAPSSTESKSTSAPLFSFGQPASAPAPNSALSFSFSGGGSVSSDVSNKAFMFGQPATVSATDRPVTPPKNDVEFRMEESPTRELQQANGNKTAATLNGAFSFGTSGSPALGGSIFGGSQSTTSPVPAPNPFGFGTSSSNPFAPKEPKPEEPKGFGGFGPTNTAPPINTSFSFGQPAKPSEDAQRPLSGGGFSFGATPTSSTAANPAFSFGGQTNAFGQTSTSSAPSSPSTFNQPSPFAFGAPAPASSASFGFGSQPASPAGGANLTLPTPSGGFSSGGFGQAQQPSSPFSGPIALAPSTSGGAPGGGSLFTIGAAPAAGPRQIKKLPTRRAGAKR